MPPQLRKVEEEQCGDWAGNGESSPPTGRPEEGPEPEAPHYEENNAFKMQRPLTNIRSCWAEAHADRIDAAFRMSETPTEDSVRKKLVGMGYSEHIEWMDSLSIRGMDGVYFVLNLDRLCLTVDVYKGGSDIEKHGDYIESVGNSCIEPSGGH